MDEKLLKLTLVGNNDCGITQIIRRYVQGTFSARYSSSDGIDFDSKVLPFSERITARLQLWGIGGDCDTFRYHGAHLRGTDGIFVVFDCQRPDSFDDARRYIHLLSLHLPPSVPVILLMTKCDLPKDSTVPTGQDIVYCCSALGVAAFFETSARNADHQVNQPQRSLIYTESSLFF